MNTELTSNILVLNVAWLAISSLVGLIVLIAQGMVARRNTAKLIEVQKQEVELQKVQARNDALEEQNKNSAAIRETMTFVMRQNAELHEELRVERSERELMKAELDRQIDTLNAALRDRDSRVAKDQQQIELLNTTIENMKLEVGELKEALTRKDVIIQQRDATIASLNKELSDLRVEVGVLRSRVDVVEQHKPDTGELKLKGDAA